MAAMKIRLNMNKLDRGLRIAGSVLLVYIGFVNTGILANSVINILLGSFGLLNLVSACAGFCPVYQLAQFSTHTEKVDKN